MYNKLEKIYLKFSNVQAVGIDGTTKQKFDEILNTELSLIQRKIDNNIYQVTKVILLDMFSGRIRSSNENIILLQLHYIEHHRHCYT